MTSEVETNPDGEEPNTPGAASTAGSSMASSDGARGNADERAEDGSKNLFWYLRAVLFTGLIVVGLYLWLSNRGPEPPTIDAAELDPAVATVLQKCEKIVRNNRRSSPAWGQYGMACLVYEFKKEARECFAHAASFDENDPRWPYFHGVALLPEETEAALEQLRLAVELNKEDTPAPRIRLANILAELGQYDESESNFQAVLKSVPNNPNATLGLGRLAFARGEFADSLTWLQQAAKSPYTARTATQLLVAAHNRMGNPELAEEVQTSLLRLPNDRPMPDPFVEQASKLRVGLQAMVDYGGNLLRNGRSADAKPLAEKAVAEYPKSAEAWMFMARVNLSESNTDLALDAAQKAVELSPDTVEPRVQLGVIQLVRSDVDAALESFLKAREIKPGISEVHHNLGLCYAAQKSWAEAAEAFRESTRLNPGLLDSHIGLGESLSNAGDKAAAKAAFEQALKIRPGEPRVLKLLNELTPE